MARGHRPALAGEKIEAALRRSSGSRTRAAQLLGCSRTTITRYLAKTPAFRAEMDAIVDRNLDRCEQWLSKWIEEGDRQAVFFYLRTKGGYTMAQAGAPNEPEWSSPDLGLPAPEDAATWTRPAGELPN